MHTQASMVNNEQVLSRTHHIQESRTFEYTAYTVYQHVQNLLITEPFVF